VYYLINFMYRFMPRTLLCFTVCRSRHRNQEERGCGRGSQRRTDWIKTGDGMRETKHRDTPQDSATCNLSRVRYDAFFRVYGTCDAINDSGERDSKIHCPSKKSWSGSVAIDHPLQCAQVAAHQPFITTKNPSVPNIPNTASTSQVRSRLSRR
jgi:hypothetical protein